MAPTARPGVIVQGPGAIYGAPHPPPPFTTTEYSRSRDASLRRKSAESCDSEHQNLVALGVPPRACLPSMPVDPEQQDFRPKSSDIERLLQGLAPGISIRNWSSGLPRGQIGAKRASPEPTSYPGARGAGLGFADAWMVPVRVRRDTLLSGASLRY